MFIVSANSLEELENLIAARPEAIVLAVPGLGLRQQELVSSLAELELLVTKIQEAGIQVYLNALKMVMEEDLPAAEELMQAACGWGVDGIYIADEGYIPLAGKYGLISRLIYQPETLIVNAMDARFYTEAGLQAICLAHELSLDEILQIAAQASSLEVLVQGRYSWMYSRRPLLSNYAKEIGLEPLDFRLPHTYTLQEANRQERLPITQGDYGTIVYAGQPKNSLEVLPALKKAHIDRFRIDTYLEDETYGVRQLQLYRQALAKKPEEYASWLEEIQQQPDFVGSSQDWFTKTSVRKEKSPASLEGSACDRTGRKPEKGE